MLLLFLLVGTALLDFFGISISAFQIAGGLLLGGVGLEMMKGRQTPRALPEGESSSPQHREDRDAQLMATAVVPLAIPLTVGAGTFSAVILFTGLAQQSGTQLQLLAAIAGLVLVNHLVFTFSGRIVHWAGAVGMSVFIKIMGLFTLSIGVEFIVRGLSSIYQRLHTSALP
jgi:multiple antibiotic resistance protein